jgi:putative endonuclease
MGEAERRRAVGQRGEQVVAEDLQRRGFQILGRNVRVGRLELDIIARRGPLLVVCEVRSLTSDWMYAPGATVDARKQGRLRRAAAQWLRDARLGAVEVRFDVAAVVFDGPRGQPRIELYEGAF